MFRRRTDPQSTRSRPSGAGSTRAGGAAADASGEAGKGRPTPSRRQAEAERLKRARPPVDRREDRRRRREVVAEQRATVRRAMETGDERHYMPRDRGPVRRFVRNYVDARRTMAEFFLPAVLFVFVVSLVPSINVKAFASLLMLLIALLLVVDTTWLGLRLRRELRSRFPQDATGHVFYGLTRAMQLRRFRLPKPQVRPGASV